MARNYEAVKGFLEQHFVGIDEISGGTYPPPAYKQTIASITSSLWIMGILLVVFGESLFHGMGIRPPQWFDLLKNNKMGVLLGLFILNNIGAQMLATGAFEIYLNGEIIHSKLESGEFPTVEGLIEVLSRYGIQYVPR